MSSEDVASVGGFDEGEFQAVGFRGHGGAPVKGEFFSEVARYD